MRKLFTLMLLCFTIASFSQNMVNVSFKLKAIDSVGTPVDTMVGVFVVGSFNNWKFQALEDLGDHVYQLDTAMAANDTVNMYFITVNSWDSAGNQDWNYYKKYREYPDTSNTVCNPAYSAWKGDRFLIIPNHDTVIYNQWGLCGDAGITSVQRMQLQPFYVTAYPNPAKDRINVQVSQAYGITNFEVFDLTGKLIKSVKTGDTNFMMDLSGSPANIYMLKATNKNSTVTSKIILR
jgi:hypothetical protein